MDNYTVLMNNSCSSSTCETPDIPAEKRDDETLIVERESKILKIAAVKEKNHSVEARIYARLMFERGGVATFSIIPTLPDGIEDDKLFKATGTAVIFEEGGKRRLKVVGTDYDQEGKCRGGWIFDATENV